MATIGNIVIGMSANTAGLKRDLDAGAAAVVSFGARVQAGSVAVMGHFNSVSAAIAAAAGSGLASWVKSSADAVDAANDFADRVGTTTESLLSLRYAAKLTGSETGSLDAALSKMTVNLGNAATEGGPAADAFKTIGLDAQKLAGLDTADAFLEIAAGLEKIPNDAQRAAAAVGVFGKGGSAILGTLGAGSVRLKALSKEFKDLGVSVTSTDLKRIGELNDSLDKLQAIMTGLGAKLASVASDAVQAAVNQFNRLVKAADAAAASVDRLVRARSGGRLGFGLGDTETEEEKKRKTEAKKAADETKRRIAVGDALLAKLKEQRDTYGMTSAAAEIYRAKQEGAAASALKEAEAIAQTIDAAEALKKAQDKAKTDAASIVADNKTPLDKFQSQVALIDQLRKSKDLTATDAAKAATKAQSDFFGDSGKRRAAALDLGSKEARSAILDFRAGRTTDETKKTAKATEETAKATARTAALMDKLIEQVGKFRSDAEPVM